MRKRVGVFIIIEFFSFMILLAAYYRCMPFAFSVCLFVVILFDFIGGYILFVLPTIEKNNFLDEVCRNQNWNDIFNHPKWINMAEHNKMEQIIAGVIANVRKEEERENYERRAILQQLQSQINPHFLYNTLESIRGQAYIDGNMEIAEMLAALGEFFRYSISSKTPLVTLREELKNIDNYLKIQNYRFSNRFIYDVNVEEDGNECFIPKLILQPILENAIIHGLENKRNGNIKVFVEVSEKLLIITVSDDGIGIKKENLKVLRKRLSGEIVYEDRDNKKSNHVALQNIDQRIKLLYGNEYGIEIFSSFGRGTDVEIILPRKQQKEDLL